MTDLGTNAARSCAPLERVSQSRRPEGRNAGTQRWRELLFLHWTFPLALLRPLVPAALELDGWDGVAWVGLVPFKMEAIRSAWMPRAVGLDFLETNVRTYVHYRGEPGVYFFSLEASSWLAVTVARLLWALPYHHATMSATRRDDAHHYRSARRSDGTGIEVAFRPGAQLGSSQPGTLEHFLLERYVLFSQRGSALLRGQVHHVPYPAQRATVDAISESLLAAAGLPAPARAPEAVHYAAGVDVDVFGPALVG